MGSRTCKLDDCKGDHHGKGFCRRHYLRWKKYGDPLAEWVGPWSWGDLIERLGRECAQDGSCWIWPHSRDRNGYGKIRVSGRDLRVSRAVLEAMTGVIGQVAMHSCDRPECANPDHLRWGTYSDNAKDMWAKGRASNNLVHLSGSQNGRSKLTVEQVDQIRGRCLLGEKARHLAREYGVHESTIRNRLGGVRKLRIAGNGDVPEPLET